MKGITLRGIENNDIAKNVKRQNIQTMVNKFQKKSLTNIETD